VPHTLPPEEDAKLIEYLRQGVSVKQIADLEGIPFYTMKSRVSRLYRKYGVGTRAELLTRYAERHQSEVSARDHLVAQRLSQLLSQWLNVRSSDHHVAQALQLAFSVRVTSPILTRSRLRQLVTHEPDRFVTLVMTLAALTPLDRSPDVALRWLTDRQLTVNGRSSDARRNGNPSS
jgi:hypothetical protein